MSAPRRWAPLPFLWAGMRAAETGMELGEGLRDPAVRAGWFWRREGLREWIREDQGNPSPPAPAAGTGTQLCLISPQETCFEPGQSR